MTQIKFYQSPRGKWPGRSVEAKCDQMAQLPRPAEPRGWRSGETRRLLDDALAQLDEKHRIVFVLRDVEGLSVNETAEALGLSEANVKMRLLRARCNFASN